MYVYDYLALTGFLGDSKLEVPLSGVGSSSGRVSNSEPSLLIARAFRGLFVRENKQDIFAGRSKEKVKRMVLCCALPCNPMIRIAFISV